MLFSHFFRLGWEVVVTSKHMEKLSFPLPQRAEGCASSDDYQAPMD